ncbi:MAG: YchF family ATPase [Fimbriimonadaceae bacterium]|nr:YchF family ATPase [Fimbriimonadaceae bacterium]
MKVLTIGFPMTGKSSLFRAAAGPDSKGDVVAVPVPDPRFDRIVAQVKPKKATPATVIVSDDGEPLAPTGKMFGNKLLEAAKKADVLIHVVRAFESEMVPHHAAVDPARDREAVDVEMVLTDLGIIENRLERLGKSMTVKQPGSPDYLEKRLFERLKPMLEDGQPLRAIELDEEELKIVRNFQFVSAKPVVVCYNVGESDAATPPAAVHADIEKLASEGTAAFAVCATLEEELAQLDPEERAEFLSSYGLTESAAEKAVRAVYQGLGLITFFTAGENDTRAWPLREGSSALKAAATIHNDIAKGFIRAEVVHYADYDELGSLDAAYKGGKMSLEGKEYVIQDGDLLHIRTSA